MASTIVTKTLFVDNMTCINCESKIERVLSETAGVESVTASYTKGTAIVTYDESLIDLGTICGILEKEDYHAGLEPAKKTSGRKESPESNMSGQKMNSYKESSVQAGTPSTGNNITNLLGIVIIIFALYIIANHFGLFNIIYKFPVAKEGMGYGMLLIIGLLTSIHCVAMCGGICLSQCVPQKEGAPANRFAALRPSLLYNTGRIISYTVIGGVVGAIGSVVSFSGTMKGAVQIIAGIFMVIMGLNMLNIFPWLRRFQPRMPKIFAKKIYAQRKSNSPLYIGLLNGLMPCGPLQAMQLYALSTGSPVKGAISMFLFSAGTVPLMFAFGALSSLLSKKFTGKMMKVSAVLVVFLGIFMFNNGISLSGIVLPVVPALASTKSDSTAAIATIQGDVQVVTSGMSSGKFDPIIVQKGIPVKWTIQAEPGDISGCNNAIIVQKYNIQQSLQTGDNVIEFTPTESGTVPFSCWMGMIRSKITVVDDLNNVDSSTIADAGDVPTTSGGGCCAGGGYGGGYGSGSSSSGSGGGISQYNNLLGSLKIPADKVAVAKKQSNGTQSVSINFDKNGLSPAIIVVQKALKTTWNIKANGIDSSKSTLIFPYYNAKLIVNEGDNPISFVPDKDFYFFSTDGSIAGYVKVVDDIGKVDIEAIKKEVSQFKPTAGNTL